MQYVVGVARGNSYRARVQATTMRGTARETEAESDRDDLRGREKRREVGRSRVGGASAAAGRGGRLQAGLSPSHASQNRATFPNDVMHGLAGAPLRSDAVDAPFRTALIGGFSHHHG